MAPHTGAETLAAPADAAIAQPRAALTLKTAHADAVLPADTDQTIEGDTDLVVQGATGIDKPLCGGSRCDALTSPTTWSGQPRCWLGVGQALVTGRSVAATPATPAGAIAAQPQSALPLVAAQAATAVPVDEDQEMQEQNTAAPPHGGSRYAAPSSPTTWPRSPQSWQDTDQASEQAHMCSAALADPTGAATAQPRGTLALGAVRAGPATPHTPTSAPAAQLRGALALVGGDGGMPELKLCK